ncbi:MAG: porin [Bacteroidales bacterium]|jgi:hypothetical protein|nr:porin [Bacteroidales bacterium]
MKKILSLVAASLMLLPAMAAEPAENNGDVEYGRKVTAYASTPKFGGYFIGKYAYSDQDGAKGGTGFQQRLIRAYVDGTILGDFKYRVQVQVNNNSFHMKDYFIEWQKYKFAMIKVGQFKRAFGFENPMNPWDISTGDYSLYYTKKMTGDYKGDSWSGGGRDQGIQVQGDFLKVGKDNHNLIHYQVGLWNGQGINKADADGKKDLIGTIQFQPIKGLFIGAFGWKGDYYNTAMDVESTCNKYSFGVKYDDDYWTIRGEWGHAQYGDDTNDDAWYIMTGYKLTDWFKISGQYQTYRNGKTWANAQCMYSIIPEFQLHKNLMFQIQYNWNDNRISADKHYNELWAEFYVRF